MLGLLVCLLLLCLPLSKLLVCGSWMRYSPSLLRVSFNRSPFFHSSFDSVIRVVGGLEVVPEHVSSNH
jgi:hypothetical protein